jgi:uncharacterized DUF497 family protein
MRKITYDPNKRAKTLKARGIEFKNAAKVFEGPTFTTLDDRFDYGEDRFRTFGYMEGHLMLVVWTPRGKARHVISMRRCNDSEKKKVAHKLG